MLVIAETHARLKDERFDRPLRDGRVFLHHSQHFVLGYFH
jgi:hypothetical protein